MSNYIPPGNRLHRDKALFGTDKGQHGPVKIILQNGRTPEQSTRDDDDVTAEYLTRQQEEDEQDYTKGCPLQ